MSTINRIREYLGSIISPPRKDIETKEHKLSSSTKTVRNIQSRSLLLSQLEERRQSTVKKEELETLYHIDGLIFRIVNKYVDSMIGPGFFFEGEDKNLIEEVNKWASQVRLKRVLEEVVKDIFVTGCGNAWVELGYLEDGTDITSLRIINPKTGIDYIRDSHGNIELDENNNFKGFKQERTILGEEVIWLKNKITVGGNTVWTPKRKDEDGRDRIGHFKLFGLGESALGMSPLEPIYRDAVIRLNITDNIGETSFRGGGIVAYVGEEGEPSGAVPDKDLDKVAEDLRNVTQQDVFAFKRNVKLDTMPIPDIKGREDLVYYFVDLNCAGLGVPLTLILEPKRAFKGEVEFKAIEFEHTISHLQEKLAEQVEDKILKRLFKARGINIEKVPKMIFRSFQPAMRLSRSRRIGKYMRDGVLNWDPELEKRIREEENLPVTYVDEKIKKLQRKRTKSEDIKKRLDEIVEKIEETE